MGKRSDFDKLPKDQYLTPDAAISPLLPFLPRGGFFFAEPCAGDGRMLDFLEKNTHGRCSLASDIDPALARETANTHFGGAARNNIPQRDAFDITEADLEGVDFVITNPPWTRTKASGYLLHNLIGHFSRWRPTWFLFDADWAHTVQAQPYLRRCTHIVSIGRVKWLPDTNNTGKDNAAWYCFHPWGDQMQRGPVFYGRGITP